MWNIKTMLNQLLALVMPSKKRTYQAIRNQALVLAVLARQSAEANDERDEILQSTLVDIAKRQQTLRTESTGLKELAVQLDNLR